MILAIIQARVSSTRLPGKVLKSILDVPMLLRQIERVQMANKVDQLLVATSNETSDDPLAAICEQKGVALFRGNLIDVLDRFYSAAAACQAKHVVRLTGDCPLCDAKLIDNVIDYHLDGQFDYTSNTHPPTYPDGLDVEICRFESLEEAWREARLTSQREHVTPFFYQHPERFRLGNVSNSVDLSALRWTVDTHDDFQFVTKIFESLYPGKPNFDSQDILRLLEDQPEWSKQNSCQIRNEGYLQSLAND